jgi:hypothetical protein
VGRGEQIRRNNHTMFCERGRVERQNVSGRSGNQ